MLAAHIFHSIIQAPPDKAYSINLVTQFVTQVVSKNKINSIISFLIYNSISERKQTFNPVKPLDNTAFLNTNVDIKQLVAGFHPPQQADPSH